MKVHALCGLAISGDYLRLTWCDLASLFFNTKVRKQFYIIPPPKKNRTDCQMNLKDLPDKFKIYRKSLAVQHLSPSLTIAGYFLTQS